MPPPTSRAVDAERRLRELLAESGLPAPDEVRHDHDAGEVLFLFHEHKLAVVIDLEEAGAPRSADIPPRSAVSPPDGFG
jgi:hypothetical protein